MSSGRLPLVLLLLGLSQVLVHAHFFPFQRPRKHGFGFSSSWRTPTFSFRGLGHRHERGESSESSDSSESSESAERPARFQFGSAHRHRPGSDGSPWQRLAERGRRKLEWLRRRKPFRAVRPHKWSSFPWQDSGIRREWASSWREAKDRVSEALCALFGKHCPPNRRRPDHPNTTPCPPPVTRPTSTPDPTTPPVTLPTLTSTSPSEMAEVNDNEQGSGGISEIEVRGITETAVSPEGEQRTTAKPEILVSKPFRTPSDGSTGSVERAGKENESGDGGRGRVDALPASTRPVPSPHAGTTERWGKENEEGGPTTGGVVDTRPTTTTTTKPTTTEEYFKIPDVIF